MRVLLVDDDISILRALKVILEANAGVLVVGEATNGSVAFEMYKNTEPDIVLMDIRMPEYGGIYGASKILENYNSAKIVFLTTFSDDEYIVKALKMGVSGYLIKQEYQKIYQALLAVMNGDGVYGDDILKKIPRLFARYEPGNKPVTDSELSVTNKILEKNHVKNLKAHNLKESELRIIELISIGFTNKEIADELHFSTGTVRNYISEILSKLDLKNRTQLALFYSDIIE